MERRIFYLITIVLILTSCKENTSTSLAPEKASPAEEQINAYPILTFEKMEHDFGKMDQGDELSTTFKFQNTGDGILQISSIKAKCGCTVPNDWPAGPILPGDNGEFTVQFNSRNKKGRIRQPVTINSNTKNREDVVTITADVQENE
ncbi:DUF1573 domain-containing protein [Dokdonia sinensis]|uniref:DUF1573 domain-containing protein n=1 Tax=Dokdonia sinensis TaxID=2479847 RepID=A0A3M0FTD4_9FLAO|nr:DUF1573 domain-containing protein [Dokdonia sinensis]RMB56060.1 DUF1573 domain-containing protein [Dokdonia sinensis]